MVSVNDIFVQNAHRLVWKRIKPEQIYEGYQESLVQNDQAYFNVRLKEMFIRRTRILWRTLYPMLHAYVSYNKREEHTVVGPGQLKDFGSSNLDRVTVLNNLLSGPHPYKGGEVAVMVGLYSIPGEDAAKVLINTVGQIAGLGGLSLGPAVEIANLVKAGVENILGIKGASLDLGVKDTFFGGNPLRSGYYVGINVPEAQIQFERVFMREGRLVYGRDPVSAKPFEEYDYMLLEVEQLKERADWPGLPVIADYKKQFSDILGDAKLKLEDKKTQLNAAWPGFAQALLDSPYLTRLHADKIQVDTKADLQGRLDAMQTGGQFEFRSVLTGKMETKAPEDFDFVDVGSYISMEQPAEVTQRAGQIGAAPF
jgi:hypothetical protein